MWIFVFASVICVPLGLVSFSQINISDVSTTTWLLILYIAIAATAAPYILNAWALARVSPSTVAIFVYLQPVIGFILAVIFLGERVGINFLFAGLLIFAGLYLAMKRNADAPQEIANEPVDVRI
jgi:drug/metabolite transporter (DMT)-like permease